MTVGWIYRRFWNFPPTRRKIFSSSSFPNRPTASVLLFRYSRVGLALGDRFLSGTMVMIHRSNSTTNLGSSFLRLRFRRHDGGNDDEPEKPDTSTLATPTKEEATTFHQNKINFGMVEGSFLYDHDPIVPLGAAEQYFLERQRSELSLNELLEESRNPSPVFFDRISQDDKDKYIMEKEEENPSRDDDDDSPSSYIIANAVEEERPRRERGRSRQRSYMWRGVRSRMSRHRSRSSSVQSNYRGKDKLVVQVNDDDEEEESVLEDLDFDVISVQELRDATKKKRCRNSQQRKGLGRGRSRVRANTVMKSSSSLADSSRHSSSEASTCQSISSSEDGSEVIPGEVKEPEKCIFGDDIITL